ncbi:MAG: S24/S26 family peptidase [Terriglobales bacterium]|jgi:hypothetical protein
MFVPAQRSLLLENTASAPRSNWSAVRSALVADVLRGNGRLRGRLLVRGEIQGESMLPTLWPGDVVEIESCSVEDVRPGEIVLALRDDRLVLHRLVAPCTPNGFLLRGDCVPGPDPVFPPEALLGRLVRRADQGRTIAARPGFGVTWFGVTWFGLEWFGAEWSRAVGVLFCHCGVARRLALKLRSRWKASQREFRNSEHAANLTTAEQGKF